MKPLPYIQRTLLRNGIRPLKVNRLIKVKDFYKISNWHIVGFDSETIRNFKDANCLYSTQIFYKSDYRSEAKCDVRINVYRGTKRLEDFPKKCIIFAHNLEFDLTNILGNCLKSFDKHKEIDGWTGFFIYGQSAGLARFRNKKKGYDLKFIDTQNFYRGSLKSVAKAELPKSKEKLEQPEYLGFRKPNKEEMSYFIRYAVRDAEICYLLGCNIYQNYFKPTGGFGYTKASLSVKTFRHKFLLKPFYLPDKSDMSFIWKCYNGARFESYGRGYFRKMKVFDINSLYPYAATFPMPFTSNKLDVMSLEEFEKNKDNAIGWVKLTGRYRDYTEYPLIPHRKSKLFFPLEFKDTHLTTYELIPDLNKIDIDKCEVRAFFPTKYDIEHPLKNYVEYIYSKKEKLDIRKEKEGLTDREKRERDFYKALLNHIYGKTGESHIHYNQKWNMKYHLSGKFFNPFVCSLITGKSRAIIGQYVKKYSGLYADTDSVATTKNIPTSSKLGGFKLENKGDMLLIRPKQYFVFKKGMVTKLAHHSFRIRFQGCKKGEYGNLLYNFLMKQKYKNKINYEIKKISKYKESIRREMEFLTNMVLKITVTLKEDNRRHYYRHFNTIAEMERGQTLSSPVKIAI